MIFPDQLLVDRSHVYVRVQLPIVTQLEVLSGIHTSQREVMHNM